MELRKVEVLINEPTTINGETYPATYMNGYFHCWENNQSKDSSDSTLAIIELETGRVAKFKINDIKFISKPNID